MRGSIVVFVSPASLSIDSASAASFPRSKASAAIERMICADAALSEYDERLARLMFMEEGSSAALRSLMRNTNAIFEVHGMRESSVNETSHFSPGACRTIYRLPE